MFAKYMNTDIKKAKHPNSLFALIDLEMLYWNFTINRYLAFWVFLKILFRNSFYLASSVLSGQWSLPATNRLPPVDIDLKFKVFSSQTFKVGFYFWPIVFFQEILNILFGRKNFPLSSRGTKAAFKSLYSNEDIINLIEKNHLYI